MCRVRLPALLRDLLHARRRRGVVADQDRGGAEVPEDEEDPDDEAVRAAAGSLEEARGGATVVVMFVSPAGEQLLTADQCSARAARRKPVVAGASWGCAPPPLQAWRPPFRK